MNRYASILLEIPPGKSVREERVLGGNIHINYLCFSVVRSTDSLCDEAVFVDSFSKLYKDIWGTHPCVIVKVHTYD